MEEALIIFAVLASVFIYSELVAAKQKINVLERKIDTVGNDLARAITH